MKNKVSLNIHQLSQAEFTQFMVHSVAILEEQKEVTSDPLLTSSITELVTDLPDLKAALLQKRGSDLSKEFTQQIKVRNADYRALVAGIRAHSHSRNPEKAKAYHILNNLRKQYKYTVSVNMQESFAIIGSFVSKLNQSPYQEAVALLNLTESVSYLEESHLKATQLFSQRNQEVSLRVRLDGGAIRKKMFGHYRLLYSHLVNIVSFDAARSETTILRLLNEIRMSFALANRSPRAKQDELVSKPEGLEELKDVQAS